MMLPSIGINKMNSSKAKPGHFYAVGVGPGSSDLLTFRAANLIESADIVIAPRSKRSKTSLALKTVQHLISSQEVIDHVYAMNRDYAETMKLWNEMAELIVEQSQKGKSIVQITLGDPMVYSTSCYLLKLLHGKLDHEHICVVPGISAFQTVASKFGEALTIQEDRMVLMPATNIDQVAQALEHCETLVLYKAGKKIKELAALLKEKKLLNNARLVCYAEQGEKEFMAHDILEAVDGKHGYMSTVIVYIDRQEWK